MTQNLREALHAEYELAHDALRPDGVDAVRRTAVRRRRSTRLTAMAVVVLLGSVALAGWQSATGDFEQVGAPCGRSGYLASVFLAASVTDEGRGAVASVLRDAPGVACVEHQSKEEAYEQFKRQYRDAPDLIDAARLKPMPESYRIVLLRAEDWPALQSQLMLLPAVEDAVCDCRHRIPR